MFTSQKYGGSYGPYARYGSSIVDMMADSMEDEPWGQNVWNPEPFTSEWSRIKSQMRKPWSVSPMETMLPSSLNYDPTFTMDPMNQGYTTPFSKVNFFKSMMTPKFGNGRLFAKKFLAHTGLLTRKLHSECPEIDGGISYLSCQLDAKSLGSKCFKMIEDHPQFHQCKRHPIVKKSIRDSLLLETEWQKQLIQCMSIPSISDEIVENSEFDSLPISTGINEDIKTVEDMEPMTGTGYDVDVVTTERQCVWKVRSKLNKCDLVALRCPKFRRCFSHPMMRTLQVQRKIVHEKLAVVVDRCLQGSLSPFWGVPQSTPFSTIPF
jgi:hypothetical protein